MSEVIDWVHTQTQVRLPFEIYYQATRVDYWQQIEGRAGAVLQVRNRTQRELENPVQSTGETGPSLDQYSHTTWSSLPSEPWPIVEEERDVNEEHTNRDCSTCHVLPVLFQWLRLDCQLAALHTTPGVCFFHVSPLRVEIEHLGTAAP